MSRSHTDLLLAGRYRLRQLLGTGGMADVYDGLDERLGRAVAVKLLRPDMAAREDVRQRFETEARSAASLSHPNVVTVFDTGEDDEVPFIVMEKLPGETLADRLQSGPVDPSWMLRVAGDVLNALGAAHAAGIVHRDVKPGNILIATDGCAKVADFGIAKSLEVAAAADLTSTNQVVGTPAYVAPERMLGQPATPQSDLYAVGVLLYEGLAGRKPFTGDTPVATAYAIQHEMPPPLTVSAPHLPRHVVQTVERAMARDPAARFATAAEMTAALGVGGAAGGLVGVVASGDEDATVVSNVNRTQVLPASASIPLVPDLGDREGSAGASTEASGTLPLGHDRRRLLLIAGGALLVLLLLFGVAAAGGGGDDGADADPASERLAADLREEADRLGDDDGPAAGEAAQGLEGVADAVEEGAGGAEATALLGKLTAWRNGGELSAPVVERVGALVQRVPGADAAALAPPTTPPPPPPTTTAPPRVEQKDEDEEDRGKGKKDDD